MRISSRCKVCNFLFMRSEFATMMLISDHIRIVHVSCFAKMRGVPPQHMEVIGRIQFEMKGGRLLFNPA